MEYIDHEYYKTDYLGEPVEDADFPRLVKRASESIDAMTSYQIPTIGFDKFSETVQELIRKATAAQVEYLHLNGIETFTNGQTESDGSVSIAGFSYSGGQSLNRQANRFSPAAIGFLQGTELIKKNGVRMRVI